MKRSEELYTKIALEVLNEQNKLLEKNLNEVIRLLEERNELIEEKNRILLNMNDTLKFLRR